MNETYTYFKYVEAIPQQVVNATPLCSSSFSMETT